MLALILLVAALVCFIIAAIGWSARVNLIAVGLALWLFAVEILPKL